MQDGITNGHSNHHSLNNNEDESRESIDNSTSHSENDDRPVKRRRLADPTLRPRSTSRPLSPPWKSAALDGPSSFIEGGRRKSSRTNALPRELQAQADKRQTRTSPQKTKIIRSKYAGISMQPPSPRSSSAVDVHVSRSRASSPSEKHVAIPPTSVHSKSLGKRSTPKAHRQSLVRTNSNDSHTPLFRIDSPPESQISPHRLRRPLTKSSSNGHHMQMTNGGNDTENRCENGCENGCESLPHSGTDESPGEVVEVRKSRFQKLKLRVKVPVVTVQHPDHVLPPKKYSTFEEWFACEGSEAVDVPGNDDDAKKEAQLRKRILQASQPGGVLSEEKCQIYTPDVQEEPPPQYVHQDHLVAHAVHLRKLLGEESRRHRREAKKLAHEALAVWKSRQPKSREQLDKEEGELTVARYKQIIRDLQGLWKAARTVIEARRLEKWKEEQERLDKEKLDRVLQQSTQLLDKRRMSRVPTEEYTLTDVNEGEEDYGETSSQDSDQSSTDDENISSSDTETDDGTTSSEDDDENLNVDQLRAKYRNVLVDSGTEEPLDGHPTEPSTYSNRDTTPQNPTRESSEESSSSIHSSGAESTPVPKKEDKSSLVSAEEIMELDEVDPLLLDDSDESTDMSDDMEDDSEENLSDDETSEDDEESEDGTLGMLGFLSNNELARLDTDLDKGGGRPLIEEIDADNEAVIDADGISPKDVSQAPEKNQTKDLDTLVADADISMSDDDRNASEGLNEKMVKTETVASPRNTADTKPTPNQIPKSTETLELPSVPIPSLLRGTLRVYQHQGLDWLARLYASNTNGILADEMGLGKTIQTIALLAHLAVEHHVWGPHLIIVPTSVMLNWEMEFKKWCPSFKILTYYGSQDERKQKRKGWTDDDKWNVIITSYQLVLKDEQAFKKRNWHFMVLDEAHNIKNFRSQRWQALLTFKTKARLLLTGTPLQNNLAELWSLLYFILPDDKYLGEQFPDLQDFSKYFRSPESQILEHGKAMLDEQGQKSVAALHRVLRPHLLRRLKADVEKQMPAKHEHIVYCRLSKRQRYLYNEYMSRDKTKQSLISGNYTAVFGCLVDLRKVCNHPDLFETRQIVTSYAMPKSVVADFEIKELLVRRRLLQCDPFKHVDLDFLNLAPISNENVSMINANESLRIHAYGPLQELRQLQYKRVDWNPNTEGSTLRSALDTMENTFRMSRMDQLESCLYFESFRHRRRPMYGTGLLNSVQLNHWVGNIPFPPKGQRKLVEWMSSRPRAIEEMVLSTEQRARAMQPLIEKFSCVTPAVKALDMTCLALGEKGMDIVREAQQKWSSDLFYESRTRLSIAFPDKRLLQYDCGKLQRLDLLLRELQAGGHRALIFTQMTKVLDILEQFLNIHGHRYLRLDGATKIEQRQILTDRFNNDPRILAFILSSRSGGLGINLTGADTVIFYDLDWNPAMDKQCQDRCHRIGQTRDVHIYRFVSEHTIESNILRKANQKRMLDDVVIQEGEFTTEYFNKSITVKDMFGENALEAAGVHAAKDRIVEADVDLLDAERAKASSDKDEHEEADVLAAKVAEKELAHVDDADFEEKHSTSASIPQTPNEGDGHRSISSVARQPAQQDERDERDERDVGHIDDFLLRMTEFDLRDVVFQPPIDKSKRKSRRDRDRRARRLRR